MRHQLMPLFGLLAGFAIAANLRAATATIDVNNQHQVIRGFGGATVFMPTTPLAGSDLDLLFGNGPGQIGLTILRIRVSTDDAWRAIELSNAKGAEARGAIVMATPWSPPASMKSNNSLIGGSLNTSSYADYATYLNAFAKYMGSNGAPLYAISVQNEPDYQVTYESCNWTADQMLAFCKNNAGAITDTRVIAPESFQFRHAMSDPILADATASANLAIIGGHIYGAGLADYPAARAAGKDVWMTEHLDTATDWPSVLATAKEINDCLAVANFNAYVWWYLKRYYGPLGEDGVVTQRGYVMAQFAKFIRPGYVRVDAPQNPATGVYVSAYAADKLVVVAVNQGTSDVTQTFSVQNGTVNAVTPWRTTSTANLAQLTDIAVSSGSFTATLPAQSVTTFVGALIYPTPAITAQPKSHTVATGSTVVLDVTTNGQFVRYQWSHAGQPIAGATGRMLTIRNAGGADAGHYAVTVTNSGGSITSTDAVLTVVNTSDPGRLFAISTRSPVGTVDNVQIGGFVISGSAAKPVLVRAAGPALNTFFNISGVLADPKIDLYDQSTGLIMVTANDWDATLAAAFKSVGAFAWTPGSKDAAVLRTLQPGAYTALVSGADGGSGNDLVEIYDADPTNTASKLVAISTRSLVQTGDGVQIGGFVIGGSTARTVVIRASGPALGKLFNIAGTLPDPVLELHDQSTGAVIGTAEGWDASLSSHFTAVGAFAWPDGSRDAAMVTTLDPGAYTVIVQGKAKDSGVALIEIYDEN